MLKGFICPRHYEQVPFNFCKTECPSRCMSFPLLTALIGKERLYQPNRYGVTEILDPPQLVYLRRHVDYYTSPYNLVYMMLGSGVHTVLEDQKEIIEALGFKDRFEFEKKFEVQIGEAILAGKVDMYDKEDKVLYDYKTIKSYAVMKMLDNDWDGTYLEQINIYKTYCYPDTTKLIIEAIVKDWIPKLTIPPIVDIEVPIIPTDRMQRLTEGWINIHIANDKDPTLASLCSEKEQWVNKNPRSENFMVPIRCKDYCPVNSICPQYEEFMKKYYKDVFDGVEDGSDINTKR